MKPRAIAIAGSIAAIAFAATPFTAIAATTSHHRPATELRTGRSRDASEARHLDHSHEKGVRADRSRDARHQ